MQNHADRGLELAEAIVHAARHGQHQHNIRPEDYAQALEALATTRQTTKDHERLSTAQQQLQDETIAALRKTTQMLLNLNRSLGDMLGRMTAIIERYVAVDDVSGFDGDEELQDAVDQAQAVLLKLNSFDSRVAELLNETG